MEISKVPVPQKRKAMSLRSVVLDQEFVVIRIPRAKSPIPAFVHGHGFCSHFIETNSISARAEVAVPHQKWPEIPHRYQEVSGMEFRVPAIRIKTHTHGYTCMHTRSSLLASEKQITFHPFSFFQFNH